MYPRPFLCASQGQAGRLPPTGMGFVYPNITAQRHSHRYRLQPTVQQHTWGAPSRLRRGGFPLPARKITPYPAARLTGGHPEQGCVPSRTVVTYSPTIQYSVRNAPCVPGCVPAIFARNVLRYKEVPRNSSVLPAYRHTIRAGLSTAKDVRSQFVTR
jgi:hypothetical protein